MTMSVLHDLVGEWELAVDLPGGEDVRGLVIFETIGEVLVQRTTVPIPEVPDSCCIVVTVDDGTYVQHYFDARGVARLYAMTFQDRRWTLARTSPDFSPLDFHQRFVGRLSDDSRTIDGEWLRSADGHQWTRDFGLTCTRRS